MSHNPILENAEAMLIKLFRLTFSRLASSGGVTAIDWGAMGVLLISNCSVLTTTTADEVTQNAGLDDANLHAYLR